MTRDYCLKLLLTIFFLLLVTSTLISLNFSPVDGKSNESRRVDEYIDTDGEPRLTHQALATVSKIDANKMNESIMRLDNSHIWKSDSDSSINISQSDDNLTILNNASKTPGIIKHAFLLTQLKNLPGTPLILSLDYASKSPNSNTKYFIQIGDDDGQNRIYFKHDLRDTSGDLAKSLFILPSSIMDKPLEFRLGIETNSTGQYMMSIKRASIVYPTSR
jgi:hypothetical protein